MLKTVRVLSKWWSPFLVLHFKTVMASFSNLKTLRVVRQWWSSFSVLKALKPLERDRNSFFFSGHALLSFISWSNFLEQHSLCHFPLYFFDYNSILFSFKKGVEHILVNTLRELLSYYVNKWFYINNVRSNRPEFSVMQLFRTFSEIPVEESLC